MCTNDTGASKLHGGSEGVVGLGNNPPSRNARQSESTKCRAGAVGLANDGSSPLDAMVAFPSVSAADTPIWYIQRTV